MWILIVGAQYCCQLKSDEADTQKVKRRGASSPLRDVTREIRAIYNRGFADCGYKTIWKMVNTTTNVKVTQETTRLVLKAIDPVGVALRSAHR